jgi:hypothetical protein
MRYIDTHESLNKRLQGHGHILGPVTGDHWFVYTASAIAPLHSASPSASATLALDYAPSDYESAPLAMKGRQDSDDSLDEGKSDRSESPAEGCPSPASPASASCADGFSYAPRPIRAFPCPQAQQGQGQGQYRTFNLMMFDMDPEVGAIFFQVCAY